MSRCLVIAVALLLVTACTGSDIPPAGVASTPAPPATAPRSTPTPTTASPPATSVRDRPQPSVTRMVDWRMSAGPAALRSSRGGVAVTLQRLTLTPVERWCPDGAARGDPVCARLTDAARTVAVVDAAFENLTGLRRRIDPAASQLVLGRRRWHATFVGDAVDPVTIDDAPVRGPVIWLVDAPVDDFRGASVELRITVPYDPRSAEPPSSMIVGVDI